MVVGYFNKNKDIKYQSKKTSLTSQKKSKEKKRKPSLGNINTLLEKYGKQSCMLLANTYSKDIDEYQTIFMNCHVPQDHFLL